jgi:rfaE bifunctional protein kinase chain/domain
MHRETVLRRLFNDFNQLNIMVIGDVMIDSYLWGKVERISPEAPIPIVALRKRENRMGGAANVAMNIKALGGNPILCSVIGKDEKGNQFVDLLNQENIENTGIIRSNKRITTTKFRIFGNSYQILRVDEEMEEQLSETDENALLRSIEKTLSKVKVDCIIFQDYDKGVISEPLIRQVVEMAVERKIPVTVDPKKKNFLYYRNVTLIKPNLKELKEGLNLSADFTDNQAVLEAVQQLKKTLGCQFVLATMSEKGVLISYKERKEEVNTFIPAHLRTISDVSGAGDTVITVASMCLALNKSPYEIAYISNLAGGLVCEEVGVVPLNKEKLLQEVLHLL